VSSNVVYSLLIDSLLGWYLLFRRSSKAGTRLLGAWGADELADLMLSLCLVTLFWWWMLNHHHILLFLLRLLMTNRGDILILRQNHRRRLLYYYSRLKRLLDMFGCFLSRWLGVFWDGIQADCLLSKQGRWEALLILDKLCCGKIREHFMMC